MKLRNIRFSVLLMVMIFGLVGTTTVSAAKTVQPGEVVSFSKVDGGEVQCRWKDLQLNIGLGCNFPPFFTLVPIPGALPPWISTTTWWENGASAAYSSLVGYNVTDWGVPFYSTGGVYNEFVIDDPLGEGGLIDVQVSIVYDADGAIGGVGMFDAGASVSLEIEDTAGSAPRIVGAMGLLEKDLNGGQGFELGLEAGSLTFDKNGDIASFNITVQRGRTYRIWLRTEAYGQPWILTELETSVRAAWHELTLAVAAEDDVVALITKHDADMKDAISDLEAGVDDLAADIAIHDANIDGDLIMHDANLGTHDAVIQAQLGKHDVDIKAKLDEIEGKIDVLTERQLEIVRLLHVPEGQRQSDVPACDGGPCVWNKVTKDK